jgi:hypothetical protein
MSLASNDFDNFEEIILNTPFQKLSQQELSDLGLEGITAEEFKSDPISYVVFSNFDLLMR